MSRTTQTTEIPKAIYLERQNGGFEIVVTPCEEYGHLRKHFSLHSAAHQYAMMIKKAWTHLHFYDKS